MASETEILLWKYSIQMHCWHNINHSKTESKQSLVGHMTDKHKCFLAVWMATKINQNLI